MGETGFLAYETGIVALDNESQIGSIICSDVFEYKSQEYRELQPPVIGKCAQILQQLTHLAMPTTSSSRGKSTQPATPGLKIPKAAQKTAFENHFISDEICTKCGELGHKKANCKKTLDELYNLEEEMQAEKDRHVLELLKKEESVFYDQFGPYFLSAPSEQSNLPIDNWQSTIYCINCGEKGHLWTECKHRLFAEILDELPLNDDPNFKEKYDSLFYSVEIIKEDANEESEL